MNFLKEKSWSWERLISKKTAQIFKSEPFSIIFTFDKSYILHRHLHQHALVGYRIL